jgi:hypothetical protein
MSRQRESEPSSSQRPPRSTPSGEASLSASGAVKRSLTGKDLAQQEAALAPQPVQRKKLATPLQMKFDHTPPAPLGSRPDPIPQLAEQALVLTREGSEAKREREDGYRARVRAHIVPWGLSFDASRVHVANTAPLLSLREDPVMALDWDGAWGQRPSMTDLPASLSPVDARAAVTAMHALGGWSKVPADDQSRLDAIIGGETNQVSAAARKQLQRQLPDMKAGGYAKETAGLQRLIGAKDALPGMNNEEVKTAPVDVTLSGPTEKKQFRFHGVKANAESWAAAFSDTTQLDIVAPAAMKKGYHQHTVQEAADAARYLPKKNREAMKRIQLNPIENPEDPHWAAEYKTPGFHSYMTAGADGVMTIYPNAKKEQPGTNYMRGTMIHESGHTMSYKNWGEDTKKGKWADWKRAMDSDRHTVSQYAQSDIAEDVAETVTAYGSTKGTPMFAEYKAIVPARFAMLEKEGL